MEGPSLYLAKKQLQPFIGKVITRVSGNTKIGKERLKDKRIVDIFSWGKHLVFQFDDFAMRIHFLLYGTFEARVGDSWITGDYRKSREPRLSLIFDIGEITTYNCSIHFYEDPNYKQSYDYSIDIMSRTWNNAKAYQVIRTFPKMEIADVLLEQSIFAGVGNIIKNEILSIIKINPKTPVSNITPITLRQLITEAQHFSKQFYRWRVKFVLRKHLLIHRKSTCPHCGTKIIREKTGKKLRWSYYCPVCQKLPPKKSSK